MDKGKRKSKTPMMSLSLGYIAFAVLVFYAVIVQGGYFIAPLIVLNIFFLVAIMLIRADIVVDVNAILFAVLFIVMAVSFAFALSSQEGIVELLKYALFPLSYLYFANIGEKGLEKAESAFYRAFILLMAFGLLGMVGFSPLGEMVTPWGRLQSFFQYANTTALALGIGAFYATEKFRETRQKPHLLMGGLFIAALIFTHSRVAFVLFFLVYLLYVFQFVNLKIKLMSLGGLGLLWGILVVADSRIARISVFSYTLVERYISYFDALGLILRNPFGIGLSNWQFMQFYYQSAPYRVRFIHNFYLHVGLDAGFIAIAIIAAVIFLSLFKAVRGVHFYICIFILLGAFFEVHFNFGIIIVYFTFVLVRVGKVRGFTVPYRNIRLVKYVLILPVILLSFLLASTYYVNLGDSFAQATRRDEAYQAYTTARRLNPFNDNLYFSRALVAQDAETAFYYLHHAYASNPWDSDVIFSLAQGYARHGNLENAYRHVSRLLEIFPFSTNNQDLFRDIIAQFDEPAQRMEVLEARIAEFNSSINRLYRHIDPYMGY